MLPRYVIHLGPALFFEDVSCSGQQLITLLQTIDAFHPELKWYVADVQAIGASLRPRREPVPSMVGCTGALINAARKVEQFESGVFVGVPQSVDHPAFRAGGLWTEDDDTADIGDAIVEVRAFDTSYWSIITANTALVRAMRERFGMDIDAE